MYLKFLGKPEQTKLKNSRQKEINIRAEINEMKTRNYNRSMKQKYGSLET
jgi:hypothetical protein